MFEFLFKYPLDWFSRGSLILPLPGWQLGLACVGIAALTYIALGYFHLRHRLPLSDRAVLTLLRASALALLLLGLTRPLLEVSAPLAQPGVVAILLDNSASMRLANSSSESRGQFIRRQFDATEGDLLRDLWAKFDIRLFSFGAGTATLDAVDALDFSDGDSNLVDALERVREATRGEPLAGLVLVSDGAGKNTEGLQRILLDLGAAGTPVYTLGLGEPAYRSDIEISRVQLPPAVLPGSRVVAEVDIRQRGYAGQALELTVESDSRILHQQPVVLQTEVQTLKIPLTLDDSGARQLTFSLPLQSDEQVDGNNLRRAQVSVLNRVPRILYFEGEPRFELKFARRALAGDENLALVGLIRTADAKFYRVGIDDEKELHDGFPSTREALFAYDALVLGSVDLSLLSRAQQQMIVDFVAERGGGLLLLGGRHAFSEGGYAESVLNQLMPVVLDAEAQPGFSRQVRIEPSAAALEHPALLLADSDAQSQSRWRSLPPLTTVNPLRQVKAGASLLLSGNAGSEEESYVAMAAQRFGRGRVVAFAVQNTWLWQMHHEIDLEDQTHELLWRQLLRWLVEEVPPRLSLGLSTQSAYAGGSIELRSEILQQDFGAAARAGARAVVTLPDGREQKSPLRPDPKRRGFYETSIRAEQAGNYLLRVELEDSGEVVSSREAGLHVSNEGGEFYASEMNESLLRRIAETTGGGFFKAADSASLVDALERTPGRSETRQRLELWDMPAIFLLLVFLLCGEWAYRRWRRQV